MYFDPSINRKKNIVTKSLNEFKANKGPLPAIIEISESGMCNRKCSFCPRSDPEYNHVNEFISFLLIEKLGGELKQLNFENSGHSAKLAVPNPVVVTMAMTVKTLSCRARRMLPGYR